MQDAPMAELLLQSQAEETNFLAIRGFDVAWIREMIENQHSTIVILSKSGRRDNITFSRIKKSWVASSNATQHAQAVPPLCSPLWPEGNRRSGHCETRRSQIVASAL
jgi:hypothetical protein